MTFEPGLVKDASQLLVRGFTVGAHYSKDASRRLVVGCQLQGCFADSCFSSCACVFDFVYSYCLDNVLGTTLYSRSSNGESFATIISWSVRTRHVASGRSKSRSKFTHRSKCKSKSRSKAKSRYKSNLKSRSEILNPNVWSDESWAQLDWGLSRV